MPDVMNLASVHKGICDIKKTIMYSHIVELPEELQEKVSNRLNDLHKKLPKSLGERKSRRNNSTYQSTEIVQ